MPKMITIDKNTITQLYHIDNLKLQEVADGLGVCKDTVRRNMKRYNIPPKASALYRKGQDTRIIMMLPLAKKLYLEDMLPVLEVCKQLGTSFYTLQRLFRDNSIQFRGSGESVRLAYSQHPNMGFQKGVDHPRFNGYRATKNTGGYILEYKPEHTRAGKNSYVGQHILVWEQANNKPLPKGWIVHHLNGIKDDNRPENLTGLSTRAHSLVLAEKANRIKVLENRVKELEQALKIHLH